jgi:hypothetical protein
MDIRTMLGLAGIALAGCALPPSGGPDGTAGIAAHHVRYSVMCEACQVVYMTGADSASEDIRAPASTSTAAVWPRRAATAWLPPATR